MCSGGTIVPFAVDTAMVLAPRVPSTAYPPSRSSVPSEVSTAAPVSSKVNRGARAWLISNALAGRDSSSSLDLDPIKLR